ncbi:hypothetical protein CBER1_00854 [Cercospora berteroae]|uniref:DUF6314 domain-containing protein n=1 Tax=Cercospora berteroae TaxID=357750 RepID=A0A2S6C1W2_9PEZI|nr:hypothetical protein CBER1_00854 [Cercospora berteroae]
MAMKTVCIVGAGPSGLASAKVLLQSKSFHVTIFEKKDRIGGIWAINRMSPHEGYLHPDTPTNLSRFTVAFSDLDWNAIGLDSVPMFPKAWQVNQYLEAYRTKNIPSDCFRFRHHITKTEKTATSWRVTALDRGGREYVQDFDYLVIGSGFFSRPRPIQDNVPNVAAALNVKTTHSSEFRTLDDLFANRANVANQKILMIGGGNSAGEAAAAVAQQLSDASWSPGNGRNEPYKGCKIVHVTPRPLYALPPYNPVDTSNVSFLPLDLKLYELSKRPPGPVVANAGQLTQAVKDMIHDALQAQIGGDQSDLGSSALVIPHSEPRSAVYVALSETYPEFVRSGSIDVHSGPYWPMIEMQARFTAQRWLAEQHDCPRLRYEEPVALLKLREAMGDRSQFVPQYWFGDYLGYIEELAAHLQLARNDGAFAEREGPISPARYLSAGDDEAQAKAIVQDLHNTWLSCTTQGKYVARATFRALQGKWRLNRNIDSRLSSFPSGVLEGEASFHPRSPTPDKSGEAFDLEYLYQETGVLRLQNGATMTARRSYIYRYSEAKDQLSIWFVKPESDLEVDYLFHNLQFSYPSEAKAQGACSASADHLCVEDMYWTKYSFPFSGISLRSFITTHTVKGPSKDYTMVTQFSRQRPAIQSV